MYHVLIIDDDNRIRSLLEKYLVKNDFLVSGVENTAEARSIMKKYIFDIMVVDYMMPNESGVEFLQSIRNEGDATPAIMLTALGEIENRIEGLSAGADDYLSKPFEPKELILRIQNILRRFNGNNKNNVLTFGEFSFDGERSELYKNNLLVKLTDTEVNILKIFFNNANTVLSREELCNLSKCMDERSVDVQITRLRKKIENDPKNPRFLKTIRHKGYVFYL
ncbi:MAG: response regulator [Rickettsiales bacterium]|nr:response regulator [Rickettsiales bacterium]